MSAGSSHSADAARVLPGDAARRALWRLDGRAALETDAQAARHIARGPVATAIRAGARQSGDWAGPRALLRGALATADPGGASESHLREALVVFELASVDPAAAYALAPAIGPGSPRPASASIAAAAALLSAVEPVERECRARAAAGGRAGAIEDTRLRLMDAWAAGEALAALAFETARTSDDLAALREGASAAAPSAPRASEYLAELARPDDHRDATRLASMASDPTVREALLESTLGVAVPALRLWNAGPGAVFLREIAGLLEGSSAGEPASGGLRAALADWAAWLAGSQSEIECRLALCEAMTDALFLAQCRAWVAALRQLASDRPGTGACTLASAMQMWLWTVHHVRAVAVGAAAASPAAWSPLADALVWVLGARQLALDVVEFDRRMVSRPDAAGSVRLLTDLCHVHCARAAGEVGRICAELVYGYRRHPAWDDAGCASCYVADELDALDDLIPGMGATARLYGDVIELDGSHPAKAGPCAGTAGLDPFLRMRSKMDGCLTGACEARVRAAGLLAQSRLPDRPDAPV